MSERAYHLSVVGGDGAIRKISLESCEDELDAVYAALAVRGQRAVELRQGQRCILRIQLAIEAPAENLPIPA